MAQVKYTKSALREEQIKLSQLQKYLPTLQLKKAMLQLEINQTLGEADHLQKSLDTKGKRVEDYSQLLTASGADSLFDACEVHTVHKRFENIAGVEIPIFEEIIFEEADYFLFDTPVWLESGIEGVRELIEVRERRIILLEKVRLLQKELREVSIRVNLFEKIMIPRTEENIKRIKIFLGDQQLAAVSQAKVAKRKIVSRKLKKAS